MTSTSATGRAPSAPATPAAPAAPGGTGLDGEAIARLRQVVVRLARRLRQHADAGATLAQVSALATIARTGPLSLGDLAAAEQIGASTTTKIIAALEGAGLVSRSTDPSDRRVTLVRATAAGRALLQRSRSSAAGYLARRVATLAPHEVAALAAALPALERLIDDGSVGA